VVDLDQDFSLRFSFVDANADAGSWHIWAERDDGATFEIDQRPISPPSAGATITRGHTGFSCPGGGCPTTSFTLWLVVSDSTGRDSEPAAAGILVLGDVQASSIPALRPFDFEAAQCAEGLGQPEERSVSAAGRPVILSLRAGAEPSTAQPTFAGMGIPLFTRIPLLMNRAATRR
jgi:hypothetical protein